MSLEERLEQDIKTALLAHDAQTALTLRTLKSVLLGAKVANGTRDQAMADSEVIALFSKEAKKRQESVDMYTQGGNAEKAAAEATEKKLIETYLPAQMSESELSTLVDSVIDELGASGQAAMGQVIGKVKERSAGAADGSMIAQIVKKKLVGDN